MSFGAAGNYYHGMAPSSGQEEHPTVTNYRQQVPSEAVEAYAYTHPYPYPYYLAAHRERRIVLWRGNYVTEREAKALRHVFDDMKDHFGHNRPDPNVRVNLRGLTHTGGRENIWEGDLDFVYNINGDYCNLAYIGMDVCIDLTPKLVQDKHGQPVLKDYGKTWVYAYLPEVTMLKIKTYVKAGTGWDVSEEGTIEDPNRNLVAIEARMHDGQQQPEPSFWVLDDDDTTIITDASSFSRLGSVQTVRDDTDQQQIHRGIGYFSVSMEVEGTPNFKPNPVMDDEATLVFTLTSFSTWGVADSIAPIVYAAPPLRR
jgi:hypothetical protein